ncbi:MAG: hypothetical protein RLZZ09_2749 [Pseudomonadota bacterium]
MRKSLRRLAAPILCLCPLMNPGHDRDADLEQV